MLANRFELLEILDQGGYGITHRAIDHHQAHQPKCVVKELIHTNPKILKLFQQEARTLEKIGMHSHIPELFAYFDAGNRFYIAQQLIQGHDLSHEIREGRPLSEGYVTKLLKDILSVLAFVHQHRMIHRDIKPANLMRQDSNGDIFLIDFGVVKALSHSQIDGGGRITTTVQVGTAGYLAPEQAQGKPCCASDLYSVGMVAIAALTGLPPQQLNRHPITNRVTWPSDNISLVLSSFIDRLIQPQPQQRYRTAAEALNDLERRLAAIEVGQDSGKPTYVAAKRKPKSTTTPTKPTALRPIPSRLLLKGLSYITVALVMLGFGVKGYQWGTEAVATRLQPAKTIPKGYEAANPRDLVNVVKDGSIQAQPEVVDAFWAMEEAAKEEGVNLFPLNGYISLAAQWKTLEANGNGAPDDWLRYSDYHTGYGMAIGDKNAEESTDRDSSFAQTDGYRWLKRYAKNYGFEPSYPKGNPAGDKEPWHWRYAEGLP